MALKITCPHCGTVRRLGEPYPLPGTEQQCSGCGRGLAISYPTGMVERLRQRGIRFDDPFADDDVTNVGPVPGRGAPQSQAPQSPAPKPPAPAAGLAPGPTVTRPSSARPPATQPRPVLRAPDADDRPSSTQMDRPHLGEHDVTEIVGTRPDATDAFSFPAGAPPPPPVRSARPAPSTGAAPSSRPAPGGSPRFGPLDTDPMPAQVGRPAAAPPASPAPPVARGDGGKGNGGKGNGGKGNGGKGNGKPPRAARPKKKRSLLGRLFRATLLLGLLGVLAGGAVFLWAIDHYGSDLPTVDTLSTYRPPTVTVVKDRNGNLLGEIYEKRRYVVELDTLPDHLVDAFLASEDANFWKHDGVDYMGIVRAVGRNLSKGKKAQGASTITQQVARNFLLSSEKTYERKIREILLSQRIEEAFDKEHILYLYMNQIYLGSGAYGVEAASRTYFGKSAADITLAEAAILAGLPQRPSDYSPHRHWEKARARQEYVLGQMLAKGFIDQATFDQASAEVVEIKARTDEFSTEAPYFTEHIRRYLVETYGFDKIYNDGLTVESTCDLELQKVAQAAVTENVLRASNSIGWNGPRDTLDEAAIAPRLAEQEAALRQANSQTRLAVASLASGKGGHAPLPARSELQAGQRYEGVVLDVHKGHAVVGVGANKVLVPLEWSQWLYTPNPERSYKARVQRDLTDVLHRGEVVDVEIDALELISVEELKKLHDTDGGPYLAGRIYQAPELEGALLSYRFSDGAVLAMVGGYSFADSEFNRATQAMRQVGSTFKPIVYAAAIGTREFTPGTLVQDAPTVFGVLGYGLYKPGNYGNDYLGHITLRRALQLSRNVVTVRVLDKIGLEPVFQLAGPTLRIGYDQPACSRTHVPADAECPGTMTPSPVEGMAWCEYCDPESCPLIEVEDEDRCIAPAEDRAGARWCRSCDISLRACNWAPSTQLSSRDTCLDARLDEDSGEVMCRVCDLSMGLGSSSLTMMELARAYSAFGTYGRLVEPHFIERVVDRDGTVIEAYEPPEGGFPQVMNESVAAIAHWMLREVATGGTGAKTNRLGIHVAGKTGTTNDFKDAWFVGYNTELITAAWVGYDQPRSMGVSFTGGDTALPIWMDFMQVAAPKEDDKDFPPLPGVSMVAIDENTGRVARGGRTIPMLPGTAPDNVVGEVGQKTAEDMLTTDF